MRSREREPLACLHLTSGEAMRRRDFITLLGGATVAWPLAAHAQLTGPARRIGVLIGFAESDPDVQSWLAAFRGALTKLGWTEGSNLRVELR
jgi:putative ABC transport system substrate-binding protein